MYPPDTLQNLIQTFSQAEKRYLRVYAERHRKGEQNQSAKLLEMLLNRNCNGKGDLKYQWTSQGWNPTQFAYTKHYLYNLTLQAMRDFHRHKNNRAITEDLLADAEFLYRRGMLQEAIKPVNKARKLAIQYDFPGLVLQADALARTLALRAPSKEAAEMLDRLDITTSAALSLQSLITETQQIYAQLTVLARQRFRLREPNGVALLEKLRQTPCLQLAAASQAFTPRMNALRCALLFAQLEGRHDAIWECQQALVTLWRDRPDMQRELSTIYLITLVNRLAYCQITDRYPELADAINLLEALELDSPIERIEAANNRAYYRLTLAINLHQWQDVEREAENLKVVSETNSHWIPDARKGAIRYNIAIAFFLLQQSKKALAALNDIVNDPLLQQREDIQQAARILQAVTHYELGNHDLLDYLLRNLKRHLQVNNALYAFEASLLKALRELLARPDDRDGILQKLKEKLHALKDDPENAHAPGLEEMQHWVEAKLQGRPIREMVGTSPKS